MNTLRRQEVNFGMSMGKFWGVNWLSQLIILIVLSTLILLISDCDGFLID